MLKQFHEETSKTVGDVTKAVRVPLHITYLLGSESAMSYRKPWKVWFKEKVHGLIARMASRKARFKQIVKKMICFRCFRMEREKN